MRTLHPRRRRFAVGVAGFGVAALTLTACTTTAEPGDDNGSETPTGGTVTIAEVNELSSFNVATPAGNVDINNQVAYFTQAGFFYLDTAPEVVYDESFGTVELVSEDPLVVTYTINEGVVWSDGTPIDADDMILSWAAASGYYDDATFDEEGEIVSGQVYFTPAGSTSGIDLTSFPEIGEDGRSITLTYSEPFADWSLINPVGVPAHVVAENAGLDPEGLVEFFEGLPEGDEANPGEQPELRALADFWNTGFDFASLPSDPSLYLASGPYIVSAWDAGQSVTLVRNESYTGDLVPAFDQVVIRFIADSTAQVQALQNGEVDIINPQASADTLASLEALSGVEVLTGPTGSYDHIDLNFRSPVFQDATVREAFLKTIPREQIVEALIRPLDPEAEVLNSQTLFIGVPGYDEAIANNGSADFAEVDIEGARELLAGQTPTVRLAYNSANPNRVDAFLAIQASAQEAGFIIEDGGLPADQWGTVLTTQPEAWDAFIFGWSTVGVGVVGNPQLFGTGGGGNYGGYSNPAVDALWDELVLTADPDAQLELILEAENLIWADHFGLPLFILPGVIASGPNIQGVEYNAWQTGPIWNFWEWTPAS